MQCSQPSTHAVPEKQKSQPWKAYPPPPKIKTAGYVYPHAAKGETLILASRGSTHGAGQAACDAGQKAS
jgi:hypothetical protein